MIANGSLRWSRSIMNSATPAAIRASAATVYGVPPNFQPAATKSAPVASSTSG